MSTLNVTNIKHPEASTPAIVLDALGGAQSPLLPPAGTIHFFAGSTAPSGWLKANGAAISRTTYAALFAAISTNYGTGDGTTTFNIPDMRGEFPRGWDDGRGADSGRSLGSAQAQSSTDHQHTLPLGFDGGQFYGWQDGTSSPIYGSNVVTAPRIAITSTSATGLLRFAYSGARFGESGETRPRNVALLAIIKY